MGGMRALHGIGIEPGVLHMNEGHSAFASLELARSLMERDGQSFQNAQRTAASMTVFTMQTAGAMAHDRFDPGLVEEALGPLCNELRLSLVEFLGLGRTDPEDEKETFCMTVLGLKMSHSRNAVSHPHRLVSRSLWRSIWPTRELEEMPIAHITNGVHVASWLAPEMDSLYRSWLGEQWQQRMSDQRIWKPIDDVHDEELWELRGIRRNHLLRFVRDRVRRQYQVQGKPDPTQHPNKKFLEAEALTIGVAGRVVPFKRQDLLLRDPDRLDHLVNSPTFPVQIVFAGKAHPTDVEAKKIIQRIFEASQDPRFEGKIVYIENCDINVIRQLVQGVDLWLNSARPGLEACGTSGMKAVLNGALHCSVLDVWWAETYDGRNGFTFGGSGENADWDRQDRTDLSSLYDVLETEVVPMFYDRDEDGVPTHWTQCQKHALRTLSWRLSSHRMAIEYVQNCYLPATGGITRIVDPGFAGKNASEFSSGGRVFLCYASEDLDVVREIYDKLRQAGHEPWMDKEDLLPGLPWENEIPKALKSSTCVLVFLSSRSVTKRGYVQAEFKLAVETLREIPAGQIYVIPVLVDDCEVPDPFRQFHWIRLDEPKAFEKVLRSIQLAESVRKSRE